MGGIVGYAPTPHLFDDVPVLFGATCGGGLVAAVVLRSLGRRVGVLVGAAVLGGLAYMVWAYFAAPTSSAGPEGSSCSDCTMSLGRYWEPGLYWGTTFLAFLPWVLGVAAGAGVVRVVRAAHRRARQI